MQSIVWHDKYYKGGFRPISDTKEMLRLILIISLFLYQFSDFVLRATILFFAFNHFDSIWLKGKPIYNIYKQYSNRIYFFNPNNKLCTLSLQQLRTFLVLWREKNRIDSS